MLKLIDQFYEHTFNHINTHYSNDLLKAKKKYFNFVRTIPDENREVYEKKMTFFNEWFLFDYKEDFSIKENFLARIEKDSHFNYFSRQEMEPFKRQEFSLFEFLKRKRRGNLFYDWNTKEKFYLASGYSSLGFLEGDFFIGRRVKLDDHYYFLKGQSLMPTEVKKIIVKQLKLIKKGKVDMSFEEFLIKLESFKSEFQIYPHRDPKEIFSFSQT